MAWKKTFLVMFLVLIILPLVVAANYIAKFYMEEIWGNDGTGKKIREFDSRQNAFLIEDEEGGVGGDESREGEYSGDSEAEENEGDSRDGKEEQKRENFSGSRSSSSDYIIVLYVLDEELIEDIRLLEIDFEAKKAHLFSVSKRNKLTVSTRDINGEKALEPGKERRDIYLEDMHAIGDGPLVKRSIEIVTGIKPDYYASIEANDLDMILLDMILSENYNPRETARVIKENPKEAYNMWQKVETNLSPLKLLSWKEKVDDYREFEVKINEGGL